MDSIEAHQESAPDYDQQALDWGWNPEVIFGLMYRHVHPGETLLDIGIGTGLTSEPFRKAGLKIYGIDGAKEMLDQCASKNITVDLKQHDLTDLPLPYDDGFFHHVTCGGVFHFFGDLQPLFGEVTRLLKKGGSFGFTFSGLEPTNDKDYDKVLDDASGVMIYKQSEKYMLRLLSDNGLVFRRKLIFLGSTNPETKAEHLATLFVTQKTA